MRRTELDREIVRQGEGQKEQKIFRPVMAAEGVDPSAERCAERSLRFENRGFESGYGGGLLGASFGADHIGGASAAPNLDVGGGIAHIVEAGLGKVLCQKRSFVRSLEIQLPVAGVDFVEKSEIVGNRLRQARDRRRLRAQCGGRRLFPA